MADDAEPRGPGDGGRDHGAPSLRQRLRYRFDNLLARGTSATLIWLAAVTVAAVLVSSLLLSIAGVTLAGSADGRWLEDVWQSLLRVMDPGTMAGDVGWGRRLLALLITIFGLLVAGTLIGIIAAGVEDRIDKMRRGRSVVIESDHTVVLGATDRLPILLQQLVLAGAEGGSKTVVVLADRDPAEMHAAARGAADSRSDVRIVYRSGDPTRPEDLALARLATARAAIVLSDGDSDIAAIETVLAIAAELGGLDDLTVVVELLDEASAHRLHRAYGASVQTIVTAAAIARTTAFALRQRGLGQIVNELLDFREADIHLVHPPELIGRTFGQLVRGVANARPIGLWRLAADFDLCPAFDTVVGPDDRVVVIGDDAHRLDYTDPIPRGDAPAPERPPVAGPHEESMVVIGWNDLAPQMLAGWAKFAAPTSALDILVDPAQVDSVTVEVPDLGSIPVRITPTTDAVTAVTAAAPHPSTIVLLAPRDDAAADVRTLLDVEALRRGFTTERRPRIVVELLDADHVALIDLDGPDDLVISDAMGSQFVAQLVDQPARRDVLLSLYTTERATLGLVPCERFDLHGEHLIRDLVDTVAAHGQVVIGWRRASKIGVTLNPHLNERVALDPGDELVIISGRPRVAG